MMWTVLAIGILSFCSACNSSKAPGNNNLPVADTLVLYQKDSLFAIGTVPSIFPVRFSAAARAALPTASSNTKTWLLLYHPQIVAMPDGAYEIYTTATPPTQSSELTPTHPSFVGVLNLYDQTGPDARNYVAIPIVKPLHEIWKQSLPSFYITLLFRGNTLASGEASKAAGTIRFAGLRIVQTQE